MLLDCRRLAGSTPNGFAKQALGVPLPSKLTDNLLTAVMGEGQIGKEKASQAFKQYLISSAPS